MASNIKNFKCLIHFNETQRGSILSEDLTYSMLHEMVMQKFKLEANAVINLSFKLSSFDFAVDITDDAEKNNQKNMFFNFFESTTLENEGPSNQEIPSSHLNNSYNNTSFLNNGISFDLGQNDFHINDSLHLQNEPHFSNPESSFDFRSNEYNTDDVVNENPQNKIHKWQKFMSFEPDIPETPVYKAKPNISKQYSQQSEVEKGKIFDNKESLILAVRLKALSEEKKEGTVTRIKTDDNGVFEMLFIAIGASGLYKGTNLVAVAMDGNNQIVPIAFGICKGEMGPCWSWWMSVLKEFIGDNPNLLFISDRHAAIALAVEKEFPLAFHDLCRAGPQRWSRAHCPLVRYNYMTLNRVEYVNACSVIYRKEPVLKLAETYRAMVQECKQSGKKGMKSATWVVKGVNAYQYEVSDGNMSQWDFENIQKANSSFLE
ncbi:transposase, MuDR, MULE transposase domain protein [Tanacetum coccineum]